MMVWVKSGFLLFTFPGLENGWNLLKMWGKGWNIIAKPGKIYKNL